MQPGSIVAIKPITVPQSHKNIVKWLPVCDEKTPYIVRQICPFDEENYVLFEEGVIGMDGEQEIGINIKKVIELLPPEDISEEVSNWQETHQVIEL